MARADKIVAIGPKEEFSCLRGVGVELVPARDLGEFAEALRRQAEEPAVALILLSEALAREGARVVAEVRRQSAAALLVVPSVRGSAGTTLSAMKHALEQSLGVDLISKG